MLSPQSEHTKSSNSIVLAPQSTLESQRPPPSSDEDFFSSASLASPTSSEENRHSPTSSAAVQPPGRPQIPISWPSDGVLTLAWVMELMRAFEWGSTAVPPSEFPSLLPVEVFDRLILSASKILHKEPNCVKIEDGLSSTSKVVVVGDVHGQLHDVLYLLREAGYPAEDRFFVFNGDYVDRGAWGLETFLLLLAWKNLLWSHFLDWEDNDVERSDTLLDVPADDLSSLFGKVLLPHRVFLLRGNHESKYCTSVYGFEKEVLLKYGDKGKHAYRKCLGCFEGLPLASIIAGRVYTAHGGLFRSIPPTPKRSKGKKTRKVILNTDSDSLSLGSLDELAKARRSVLDPPWEGQNLIPGDVLWSDPSLKPGLSPNKERGIGLLWGPDCTEDFLKKFSLKLIIRSHEGPDAREKRPGLGEMGEGYTIDHAVESGNLITVFSAPDYPQFQATEHRYRNKGAYIVLGPPDFDTPSFHNFEAVLPRPQVKPYYDYEDCIDSDEELDMASMIEIE